MRALNATIQGKSRKGYACYGRVVVTGPGIETAGPAVDVDMFHQRSTLRDRFRDKDMILNSTGLVHKLHLTFLGCTYKLFTVLAENVGVALNGS